MPGRAIAGASEQAREWATPGSPGVVVRPHPPGGSMSTLARSPRVLRPLAIAAAATLLLTTALSVALVRPASAHGSVVDPASRSYSCWQRWGSDFQNPRMATEDPMCWQAWQADPQAMWNWNGLFREGVAGNHQGAIPDGQLCSGGHTQNGRYNALDTVGAWKTTPVVEQLPAALLRPGQPRRRLHPGVRDQAGLQLGHPAAGLERPGAGRPDRQHPGLAVGPRTPVASPSRSR